MSVKDYAVQDIQEELSRQGKCFLAFHEELNPIMDYIVNRELQIKESIKSKDNP